MNLYDATLGAGAGPRSSSAPRRSTCRSESRPLAWGCAATRARSRGRDGALTSCLRRSARQHRAEAGRRGGTRRGARLGNRRSITSSTRTGSWPRGPSTRTRRRPSRTGEGVARAGAKVPAEPLGQSDLRGEQSHEVTGAIREERRGP